MGWLEDSSGIRWVAGGRVLLRERTACSDTDVMVVDPTPLQQAVEGGEEHGVM